MPSDSQTTPNADKKLNAIFVDLDDTLVSTDTLYESLPLALHKKPTVALSLIPWVLQGKATLKNQLAAVAIPQADILPYNQPLIEYLKAQKAEGTPLILATAAHESIAQSVATHLDLFDHVLASTPSNNLKGSKKAEAIKALAQYKQWTHIAYAGDTQADIPIWNEVDVPIAISPSDSIKETLSKNPNSKFFYSEKPKLAKSMIRALRPQQWVKNLLLFVPIVTSHSWFDFEKIAASLLAFICFSFIASSGYLVNDMFDIESDRKHPKKRKRPFASTALNVPTGVIMTLALILLSAALSLAFLPGLYSFILLIYMIGTYSYSFWLKTKPITDVIVLAGLYTIRIFAGGASTGIVISEWLLGFSVFIFTSLAFAKRYAELDRLQQEGKEQAERRGYYSSERQLVMMFGVSSGFNGVLLLALYLSSEAVRLLYPSPQILWLICPVILFWISRIWILASRHLLTEDPILFAIKDKVSFMALALMGIILIAAAKITIAI